MVWVFRGFDGVLVSIVSVNAFAQNCNLSGQTTLFCDREGATGSRALCTLSIKNSGTADCAGNWTSTLGSFDQASFSQIQASPIFGNCSPSGDVTLPTAVFNETVLHSTLTCTGSGTLSPGASASMTWRVMPRASFTGSTLVAASLLTVPPSGLNLHSPCAPANAHALLSPHP